MDPRIKHGSFVKRKGSGNEALASLNGVLGALACWTSEGSGAPQSPGWPSGSWIDEFEPDQAEEPGREPIEEPGWTKRGIRPSKGDPPARINPVADPSPSVGVRKCRGAFDKHGGRKGPRRTSIRCVLAATRFEPIDRPFLPSRRAKARRLGDFK